MSLVRTEVCPECGKPLVREVVDVGVGEIPAGPLMCEDPVCNWIEEPTAIEVAITWREE